MNRLTIAATTVVLISSCSADKDSAGLEYMPDMYRSAAIEPYVDYGEFREERHDELKVRLSALVPPRNTIPYCGTDSATVMINLPYFRLANVSFKETHGMYDADLTMKDEYTEAANDKNPLKLTDANKEAIFNKGKYIFNSKCAHCHGEKGDGNGPMVKSGAFTGAADLTALQISEGQMFYSIYYGKGMMGAHGPILSKEEIWTTIHYIKKLQDANYGSADAAPAMEAEGMPTPDQPE